MKINLDTGLVKGVDFHPSPHISSRLAGVLIDLLVVHAISKPCGGFHEGDYRDSEIHALFTGQGPVDLPEVSVHFVIYRDGRAVQYVPLNKKAWHAGVSCFEGRKTCNDFSIGIELEGDWQKDGLFEDIQYERLEALTREITACYPGVTPDRIVRHSDIAPGRKFDPGDGFDMDGFIRRLTAL